MNESTYTHDDDDKYVCRVRYMLAVVFLLLHLLLYELHYLHLLLLKVINVHFDKILKLSTIWIVLEHTLFFF